MVEPTAGTGPAAAPIPGPGAPGPVPVSPSAAAGGPPPPPSPPAPPLLQTLQSLWRELPGLVSDRIELLSLELRRAGLAVMQIVALVIAIGILGVTAWLVLWAAIVLLLTNAGLPLPVAMLAVMAVNIGAAWWAVAQVRRLVGRLTLPATRRHLVPPVGGRHRAHSGDPDHPDPRPDPRPDPDGLDPRTAREQHSSTAGA